MANESWQNWAGNVVAGPVRTVRPTSTGEIADTIVTAADQGLAVKSLGAGHSFTPTAATDGVLVSLDDLTGIEAITPTHDDEGRIDGAAVTVWAGTRLHRLSPLLWDLGLAIPNLGDFDQQSLAGAVSTGTHGTGVDFGGLPTMVTGLQLVTAGGAIVNCSPQENPEIFEAARLGIGGLGIISKLTLGCTPAFALRAEERDWRFSALLQDVDGFADSADHAEFYWFPHTDNISVKQNTRLPGDTPLRPVSRVKSLISDQFLSNEVFDTACRLVAARPTRARHLNAVTSRGLSQRSYTDRSYRVFASPRRVRFREMEYAVPRRAAADVLRQIRALTDRRDIHVPFPVEVRFARADDVWLSTAYGRDVCYIAIHQYWRMDHTEYFARAEEIFRAARGRPHWGKLHSLTAEDFEGELEHFGDFVAIRDQLDPDRTFANEYTGRILP